MLTSRYAHTKLFQILAVRELTALLPVKETGVVINLVNPGLCNTGLTRHGRLAIRLQTRLLNALIGRTPEMGSRTLLHAAIAGEESHGVLLSECENRE